VGYKIGLELMVKCRCQRIREIPIHFSNRVHGSSKLTIREQINYLRHLRRLYWYKWWARK
jgi:dolichol-phosphate mannosyltransferase